MALISGKRADQLRKYLLIKPERDRDKVLLLFLANSEPSSFKLRGIVFKLEDGSGFGELLIFSLF